MRGGVQKILIFSAHPDDSDFACAGTLAKLIKKGAEAVLCVITNGNKGIHWNRLSPAKVAPIRKKEQRAASRLLGIKRVVFLGKEDGALENERGLRKKLVKIIRRERPDIVFSFDPANREFDSSYLFHRDHRTAAEAVFDAVYPEAGCDVFYPDLAKRGLKPHTVKEVMFFGSHKPNVFIDISATVELKLSALRRHKSQIGDMEKLSDRVRRRAKEAGRKRGIKYAEPFRKIELES